MVSLYCVRADFGTYTAHFVKGGYVAIDYGLGQDLSAVSSREALAGIFRSAHPEIVSNVVLGQQVGQLARFLLEMKAGDFVITPASDTEWLHYGFVAPDPSYFLKAEDDGCPYRQRRRVNWMPEKIRRSDFSVPFQNTIRSSLTVFQISQRDEFFEKIGKQSLSERKATTAHDPVKVVLDQILELDDKEFEVLITHLLTALGFEGSEHTGKTGDGGVDATGELNVSGLAKIKIFVQAKRYKLGTKISANTVKQLRQAIPRDGQGAFITTADFQLAANEIAIDPMFPRIGLINGRQLVDLLVAHWVDIPSDFRERLNLRPGLVLA